MQRKLPLILVLALIPQCSWAHLVSTRFGEFYAGMLHPVLALNHLLPWLALALLAGLQPVESARRNLLLFPLAVATGTVLGCLFPESSLISQVNLLAFFSLGLLVTLALRLHQSLFTAVALVFGVIEGYGNGTLDVFGTGFLLYVAGVTVAAYIVMTITSAAANWISGHQQWGSIAVRALGSWIMAAGILYSGFLILPALQS
ncbi:MAG: hypothetical protein CMK89_11615 [Pseudomonadales bacterium]|nr:hypothetical protein [Pseudomonadales bacterium]RLU03874.1 MAG: hypothetical protein D9N11_01885 [Ketobacter sp.]